MCLQAPGWGCQRGRGLTLQIHGYQSFCFQVGQEGLHPVEEKASAAVQYLLPVRLAAQGENTTSGLGEYSCNPSFQQGMSPATCTKPFILLWGPH